MRFQITPLCPKLKQINRGDQEDWYQPQKLNYEMKMVVFTRVQRMDAASYMQEAKLN